MLNSCSSRQVISPPLSSSALAQAKELEREQTRLEGQLQQIESDLSKVLEATTEDGDQKLRKLQSGLFSSQLVASGYQQAGLLDQ